MENSSSAILAFDPNAIEIRTMLDDLADARSSKTASPDLAAQLPAEPAEPVAPPEERVPAETFPLPPRPRDGTVSLPPSRAKSLRPGTFIKAAIFFVALAVAGAATGWYYFAPQIGTEQGGQEQQFLVADMRELIPSSASLWMRYSLTPDNQTLINNWWEKEGTLPSFDRLFLGDPRYLMTDKSASQLIYVLLPQNPVPFTLLPKTASTQAMVAAVTTDRIIERDGWYVVHPHSIVPYTNALAQGSLGAVVTDMEKNAPIVASLHPDFMRTLVKNFIGDKATSNRLILVVQTTSTPSLTASTVALNGYLESDTLAPPSTATASLTIDDLIPATAQFVSTGKNFNQALTRWEEGSLILDSQALNNPQVAPLIQSLTGPYALYSVTTQDNRHDIGLIVELPIPLNNTLKLKDPLVEQALLALLPLYQELVTPTTRIEFLDNSYQNIALRYANFSNPLFALDYTIHNGYLVLSTSKASMFATLERLNNVTPTIQSSPQWQTVITALGQRAPQADLILGQLNPSLFGSLVPKTASDWHVGVHVTPADGKKQTVTGIVAY